MTSRVLAPLARIGPVQRALLVVLSVVTGAWLPVTFVSRHSYGIDACLVGVGVLVVGTLVVAVVPPKEPRGGRVFPLAFAYAAPALVAFIVYFLAYYPALMSSDSYTQWKQIETSTFNAFLPLVHTLFFWVVSRIWMDPAALVIVQAVIVAVVVGAALAVADRAGAPRYLTGALAALFALHPLNGVFAVTLWKDVLFSASVLVTTLLVYRVVQSDAAVLARTSGAVGLGLALGAVCQLRPNGIAPVLLTLVVLLALYFGHRRGIGIAALVVVAVFGVKSVLSWAVHESYERWGIYSVSPFVYDVGAVLHEEAASKRGRPPASAVRISPEDRKTLSQFDDVGEWGKLYTTQTFPYWHTKKDHWLLLDDPGKRKEFMRAWSRIAWENRGLVLHHRIQLARVGWIIDTDDRNFHEMVHPKRAEEASLHRPIRNPAPDLAHSVDRFVRNTVDDPKLRWFTAHPGLPTYLCVIFGILFAIKRKSLRALSVSMPILGNWIATMIFCVAEDVRYFYVAFLVLPFLIALSFTSQLPVVVSGGD